MSRVSTQASRPRVGEVVTGFEPLEPRLLLASLLVTNVNDSGTGSLRQAILDANASASSSTIGFDIPGSGFHKIELASGLPTIVVPLAIDARTQPGYAGTPLIGLDGMDSPNGFTNEGLFFNPGSTGSSVEGLAIVRFVSAAIEVLDQQGIMIQADDIGYDPSGGTLAPGNGTGIFVEDASNVTIGGPTVADGNLVDSSFITPGEYGSRYYGSGISLTGSTSVTVQNNIIGTDPTLTAILGNAYNGIDVGYSTSVSILSNTIANSGYQAIGETSLDTSNTNNDLINNGINIASLSQTAATMNPVVEGQSETITYTITNNGPHEATNVEFNLETEAAYAPTLGDPIDSIPVYGTRPNSLFSIESVSPSQGTSTENSSSIASVALGTLANGASATVTVVINAMSAGTDGLFSGVVADQFTLNNYPELSTFTPVKITGNPDLAAVALPTVGTAKLGVPYTFQFVVTNHDTMGVVEANFVLVNTRSPSSVVDSVTLSSGINFDILGPYTSTNSPPLPSYSYYDGGDLGELSPGASATVTVTLTPTQLGPLVVLFATSPTNVNSSALDVNPVDNLAYAGVPVLLSPTVVKTSLLPTTGNPQSITVDFDAPLVASTANDLQDYRLTTTDSGKTSIISIRSVQYYPKTESVTLNLSHSLSRKGKPLRLILSGLTGIDGSKLLAGTNVVSLTR